MELTGLLQMAPFQGMKEEELTYVKGCTFLHREVYGRE